MAIVWHVFRDKTEANPGPPAVNGVSPIEGGLLARHDDVTDNVNHCFYIILGKPTSGAGVYTENWRVQNSGKTAVDGGPYAVNETVPGQRVELILLPPATAQDKSPRDLLFGSGITDPSEAQIIAMVSGWSTAIQNNFGRTVTRAVFNSDVANPHIQAEF